jgi:large conductance mechanosensitive channel
VPVEPAREAPMFKEFKEFINRGNLVDIAVAFVLGIAFGAVVTSLTDDIVNPLIGKIFNLDGLGDWVVYDVRLGAFLLAVINFVIVAFVLFIVVKAYNRMRAADEPVAEEGPSEEILLLRAIRDSLRS